MSSCLALSFRYRDRRRRCQRSPHHRNHCCCCRSSTCWGVLLLLALFLCLLVVVAAQPSASIDLTHFPRSFRLKLRRPALLQLARSLLSRRPGCSAAAMTAAVEAHLEERKGQHILWHTVLNNNASTRPRQHGGALVRSITACKTFSASSASGEGECALELPNSFANGDGLVVQTSGTGASRQEASEVACLRAVARLISSAKPSEFVLRPKRWTVSPDELLVHLPGADLGHQPLPMHIPARASASGEEEAATPDADARIVALLRECLDAHGGEFDPSWIWHDKKVPRRPDEEGAYSSFNKLLFPGSTKAFIESHPEFAWRPKWGAKGMLIITWADGQVAQAAPPIPGGRRFRRRRRRGNAGL